MVPEIFIKNVFLLHPVANHFSSTVTFFLFLCPGKNQFMALLGAWRLKQLKLNITNINNVTVILILKLKKKKKMK